MSDEKSEIKAILIGNPGVGKTSLINTCLGMDFDSQYISTSSGSFRTKKIIIDDKLYTVNLWDTAGQETYKAITKIFLKNSQIVIFVYDISDIHSFKELDDWIEMCKQNLDPNEYISGIVGNKFDLFLKEQIPEKEARQFAQDRGMKLALVSAKDNPEAFEIFLKELIDGNPMFSSTNIDSPQKKGKIELKDTDSKKKKKKCC
jgi:small GTP-binding protein